MTTSVTASARFPRGTFAALIAVAGISVAWLAVAMASPWPRAYFLVWLLFLLASLPMIWEYVERRLDVFAPITTIRVLYVVYFGVAAVYELNTLDKPRLTIIITNGVSSALAMALVALSMLEAGHRVVTRGQATRRAVATPADENWPRVFAVIVGVWLIGIAARIYGISRGFLIRFAAQETAGMYSGTDLFYDYLGFFSTFGYVLMAAYAFAAPYNRKAHLLAWGVMLPTQLLFAFMGGPKQYFIPIIVAPLICFHYLRRPLPVSRMIVPFALFALVVFPIMTAYRSLDSLLLRNIGLEDQLRYATTGVSVLVAERGVLGYLTWGLGLMVERMDGIYTLTGVLQSVPHVMEYQWGKTLTVGFALLVPTFIWPGKYDYMVSTINWGERIFGVPPGASGISIGHAGELFVNFGVVGVVVGMFLLGIGFAALHRWLTHDRRFFGVVIFALLWPTFVIPEYPFAAYFSDAFKQFVLLFLISLAAGARWRTTRAPGRPRT